MNEAALFTSAWFDRLESRLAAIGPLDEPVTPLALGQVVTGTPEGEVAYTIVFGGGRPVRLVRGGTDGAAVTLVENYETAARIASGEPAGELLAAGGVKVRGDANALLTAQKGLAAIAEAFGGDMPALGEEP